MEQEEEEEEGGGVLVEAELQARAERVSVRFSGTDESR